jgi:hypothetical protein
MMEAAQLAAASCSSTHNTMPGWPGHLDVKELEQRVYVLGPDVHHAWVAVELVQPQVCCEQPLQPAWHQMPYA